MDTRLLTGVYGQLMEQCNAEQIRELVRLVKLESNSADKDLVLGKSKEETVRNLRVAVERSYLRLSRVYELLVDCEESGQQHVLLLTPAPPKLRVHNLDMSPIAIATKLFDEIPTKDLFPRFDYPSSGYSLSDFRIQSNDWTAKAYGREHYRSRTGVVTTEERGNGTLVELREFLMREVKAVLVAKWRSNWNLLELRVDVSGIQNSQSIQERRDALWKLLEPAISRRDFVGWTVDKLLQALVFERGIEWNRKTYTISRVELTDSRSGQVLIVPLELEELDSEPGRQSSLAAMEEANFVPSLVRINWLPNDTAPKELIEPVTAVLEKTPNGPELRILKRVNRAVYEYILEQLRNRIA